MRKKDIIRLCEEHQDCVFSTFTNGTPIDEAFADEMLRVQNFMPAISIEGFEEATDGRRGEGTYEKILNAMLRSMKTGNINLLVTGKENIPDEDGFIFYPNHQGIFDGFAMVEACDRPFSPVIKKELMQVSFVKQIFGCLDAMPMDRENVRQSMEVMIEVMRRVKDKENCLIFPEGTRSREGNKLRDFKGGSFKPAVKTKCPIVPVALIDSYLPFDTETDKPVTVQVHILRPLLYEEYRNMKTVDIAKEVKQRIENAIESQS